MAIEEATKLTPAQLDAIHTVLDAGFAVSSACLDTWIVKDGDMYCVDGTGDEPIEEDYSSVLRAVAYFLDIERRFEKVE